MTGDVAPVPSMELNPVSLTPSFLRRSVRTELIAAFLGVAAVMVTLGLINVAQMSSIHGQVEDLAARDVAPLAGLQQLTDDFRAYSVHGLVAAVSATTGQFEVAAMQTQLQEESRTLAEQLAGEATELQRVARSTL